MNRRWPLLIIGASAGAATWSGWVGLGELTGFGVVHPLPGIWDSLSINTAVTLPIGVEAYAIYALSIATASGNLSERTRRYAWASAGAALVLGMLGQVAYHVLVAALPPGQLAPWQIIALVSCLPVLVLGAASVLWHLVSIEPAPALDRSAPGSIEAPPIEDPIDRPSIDPIDPPADSIDRPSIEDPIGSIDPPSIDPIEDPIDRPSIELADRRRSIEQLREEFERLVKDGQLRADSSVEATRKALNCAPARARIILGRKSA